MKLSQFGDKVGKRKARKLSNDPNPNKLSNSLKKEERKKKTTRKYLASTDNNIYVYFFLPYF